MFYAKLAELLPSCCQLRLVWWSVNIKIGIFKEHRVWAILSIKQWIIVLMYLPYVCHGVTLLFVAQTFWCDCELPQYHVHWMRLAPGQHLKSLKEHLICLNLSDNPFWLTLYITIDINDSPLNDAPKRCLAKQSIVVVFPTPGGPKNKLYFEYHWCMFWKLLYLLCFSLTFENIH